MNYLLVDFDANGNASTTIECPWCTTDTNICHALFPTYKYRSGSTYDYIICNTSYSIGNGTITFNLTGRWISDFSLVNNVTSVYIATIIKFEKNEQ